MKKFTLITIFYLLITNFSFAESYPNSCPAEAQAIIKAVGGCSAVNKNQYPTVYEKCCTLFVPPSANSSKTPSPTPNPRKTPYQLAPKALPAVKLPKPIEYTEPFQGFPKLTSSTQTSEATTTPSQPKNLTMIVKERFQQIFNRLFQFLRFR